MRIKDFNRFELKYVIPANQIESLIEDLKPYTELDPNATNKGGYRITSLYFDTVDYQCYWQKLDGTNYRRKLRIRIYGNSIAPTESCFVEIKEKRDLVTRKRRMDLPYTLAETFCLTGDIPDECVGENNQSLVDEIRHIAFSFQMQTACIVSYDRLPLNGHTDYNPDLRITFDTNMRGRIHDLTLTSNCQVMRYFMPPTTCIFEVKVNRTVPHWLLGIMSKHHLDSKRFSKYAFTMAQESKALSRQRITVPKVLTRYD
jgi:hypothetical protein